VFVRLGEGGAHLAIDALAFRRSICGFFGFGPRFSSPGMMSGSSVSELLAPRS
jgi:hypothetical protein